MGITPCTLDTPTAAHVWFTRNLLDNGHEHINGVESSDHAPFLPLKAEYGYTWIIWYHTSSSRAPRPPVVCRQTL